MARKRKRRNKVQYGFFLVIAGLVILFLSYILKIDIGVMGVVLSCLGVGAGLYLLFKR